MAAEAGERARINYVKEIAILRNPGQVGVFICALALLIILPYFLQWTGNANWFSFLNITLITIVAVLGLNITTGMAGQVSMGHGAFIMVGAFATGILVTKLHWPFWGALPVSAFLTAIIGMIVGAPSLRLKGFYLAVATLAFFQIVQYIVKTFELTGGINGINEITAPSIFGFQIRSETAWYYFILIFAVVFIFFSMNLASSRLGRAFLAVRDNEATASSLGIQPYTVKLRAFFIGSLFAGVAGSLLASYMTIVRPTQFTTWDSISYLGMIVIGGYGSTAGTILGVIFLRLVGQVTHLLSMSDLVPSISNDIWVYITSGLYGLAVILFISFQPHGMMGWWKKLRIKYPHWPFGI